MSIASIPPLRFPGGHKAALSLTFDDGFRSEVQDALAALDPLGLKGTFFLIPEGIENHAENMLSWEEARALLAAGHEIGTHGYTKYKLHEVDDARLEYCTNGAWSTLRDRLGCAPVSYATPGGSDKTDPRVRTKIFENHLFLRENALIYGNRPGQPWSECKMRLRIEEAEKKGEWLVACIHSIIGGYSPFDSKEAFHEHCRWLHSKSDTLWIAPMGTVGRMLMQNP